MQSDSKGFKLLQRFARDEIVHVLESVVAEYKDLYIDECLMKPLDRVAGAKLLKQHGIDRIFKFDSKPTNLPLDPERHNIYLLRPTPANARVVADSIVNAKRHSSSAHLQTNRKFYTVVFVPYTRNVCESLFEQYGIYSDLAIETYGLLLIPLESDLLSLEMPEAFQFFLHDASPCLNAVARSLLSIRATFGDIPNVYAMGKASELCHKISMRLEDGPSQNLEFQISHLFMFDRSVDFASMFLTGLTYETLLSEHFDVKCGFIDFPPSVTKTQKYAKYLLSDDDDVFASIRHRHFSTVFSYLSETARTLQATFDKKKQLDTVNQLKNFVTEELRDLQNQHRSLTHHIGACEEILQRKTGQEFEQQLTVEQSIIANKDFKVCFEFIENWMCQQLPEYVALSLICALSVCQEGIQPREYQSLRTQFLHAYGHKHLVTWYNLKRLGILYERKPGSTTTAQNLVGNRGHLGNLTGLLKSSTFTALWKKFQLYSLADAPNYKNPLDMSYVFNGAYIPLICQIVSHTLMYDNFNTEELSKYFQCPFVKESASSVSASPEKVVLVYFVGGVTYAELACLRWLAQKRSYQIVVATTHVINRQQMVKQLAAEV